MDFLFTQVGSGIGSAFIAATRCWLSTERGLTAFQSSSFPSVCDSPDWVDLLDKLKSSRTDFARAFLAGHVGACDVDGASKHQLYR